MSDDNPHGSLTPTGEAAIAAAHTGAGGRETPETKSGRWLIWLGNSFALLWVGAAAAFIWGYLGVQSLEQLSQYGFGQLTGLAVFALAPALLFIMSGLMAGEVVRNAGNTRRVELAIRRLAEPALYAEHQVQSLSTAVTQEVERINSALESALARLAAMEEVISHHAETLEHSATDARDRTEVLLKGLRNERQRLGEVSESLDDKAALIAAAISDQSKMVAAAAELAASQASDSEKRIRASVDNLHEAGTAVTERSDAVAAVIDQRTTHLRELSESLKERSENLDAAYVKHRKRLAAASDALRDEQEKIASALDFHKAELETMATTARGGADSLNEAARAGAEAFRSAVDAALARADELAEQVHRESEHAAHEHEAALSRLVAAAQEAREVSEAAINAMEAQADVVSSRVEKTNEAAYEAARRSDEAFELRLAEAEKLTNRAAQVADEAAAAVRKRLEGVLASARSETETVEQHIARMTEKLGEMPIMARDRAEEATQALQRGLDGLNAAAMAAAEEAQEIDAAFQARIRQNYELLSDFMLRMGSVAGGRRVPDLNFNELPDPLARRSRPEASQSEPEAERPKEAKKKASPKADEPGLSDDDMNVPLGRPEPGESRKSRRETAAEPQAPGKAGEAGWRWKDLLNSMPSEDDTPSPRSRKPRKSSDED
ncbi:hypothetical protein [Maricaulis sp. CAU 1757]